MDLYVLRHGLAGVRSAATYPNDDLRPLTDKGRRRIARQARGLNSMGLSLDVMLSSPLARAVQTARIVHEGLDSPGRLVACDALAEGNLERLMGQIAGQYSSADSVMVVGHEPDLSALVAVLTTGDPDPTVRFKKGALCKLRLSVPRYGRCGWIEWMLTPRQMVKLG